MIVYKYGNRHANEQVVQAVEVSGKSGLLILTRQ